MDFIYADFSLKFFEYLKEDMVAKVFAAIIVAAFAPVLWIIVNRAKKWLACCGQIRTAITAVSPAGKGLWLSVPPRQPENYRQLMQGSIPILVIANLKGGVGKTTLAANLTASFAAKAAAEGDKPILAIDLDYQGSLSSMLLPDAHRLPASGSISKAGTIISGEEDGFWITGAAMPVLNVNHAWCIPAHYDLASVENRLMVEWLLGERTCDIRYNLAEILLSPAVRAKYSRIIIDAPPRLTTATIQALCASTQILIPTKLDVLSAEAVGSFIAQVKFHGELFPDLKMVGVAGTMNANVKVPGQAILAIQQALVQQGNPTQLLEQSTFIPQRALIGLTAGQAPGQRIVYNRPGSSQAVRDIRENFDRLRDAL